MICETLKRLFAGWRGVASLRASEVSGTRLYFQGSDGREFELLNWRAALRSRFQSETGTVRQRVLKTLAWLNASIVAALGPEMVSGALISLRLVNDDESEVQNWTLADLDVKQLRCEFGSS